MGEAIAILSLYVIRKQAEQWRLVTAAIGKGTGKGTVGTHIKHQYL
jgi:hypothetical protein